MVFVVTAEVKQIVIPKVSLTLDKRAILNICLGTTFTYYPTSRQTSHIPHPTFRAFHIPNIPYLEHPTSRTSHIPNISHPKHPTFRAYDIPNMPHPEHPTSPISHIPNIHTSPTSHMLNMPLP